MTATYYHCETCGAPIGLGDECDHAGAPASLEPADPGDVRFMIEAVPEPELGCTHLVTVIDDRGDVVERFTTDNPYGAVEACREAQTMTLEERFDYYAERGW